MVIRGIYFFIRIFAVSTRSMCFVTTFFPRRKKEEGHLPWRSVRPKHFLPPCSASLHRQTPDSPLADRVNQNVGWAASEREAPGACEDCTVRQDEETMLPSWGSLIRVSVPSVHHYGSLYPG